MRDALKSLKEDESIMVLPADKGRASVVMGADTYRTKMSTLIETGPYQRLNKDPTDRNSDFTVTNSAHFVSTISSETILDDEIMVSFDVESLFTNVPIDGAVQAALRKLENDPSLADRMTLTPAHIADLLTFVLRSTYFQYNGSIYEQQEGAAMGSPVSYVIANLYMESFEEQAITSSSYKPKIWKRYVDDTFTILDRENVDSFLQHLNIQQPSIYFTMETEKDHQDQKTEHQC
ncbi:uncharacterized protein LOC144659173 [Oculina patagonica]